MVRDDDAAVDAASAGDEAADDETVDDETAGTGDDGVTIDDDEAAVAGPLGAGGDVGRPVVTCEGPTVVGPAGDARTDETAVADEVAAVPPETALVAPEPALPAPRPHPANTTAPTIRDAASTTLRRPEVTTLLWTLRHGPGSPPLLAASLPRVSDRVPAVSPIRR